MDRRTFLIRSAMLAAGGLAVTMLPGVTEAAEMAEAAAKAAVTARYVSTPNSTTASPTPIQSTVRSYAGGGTATKSNPKSCAASCAS